MIAPTITDRVSGGYASALGFHHFDWLAARSTDGSTVGLTVSWPLISRALWSLRTSLAVRAWACGTRAAIDDEKTRAAD